VLDTLFDEIIMDVNREDFTVGDKYKAKQEEIGKISQKSICFIVSILLLFYLINQT
jgi:hypothetical protein